MTPDPYVESQVTRSVSWRVAKYYVLCDPMGETPFGRGLATSQDTLQKVQKKLKQVSDIADANYPREMVSTLVTVHQVNPLTFIGSHATTSPFIGYQVTPFIGYQVISLSFID